MAAVRSDPYAVLVFPLICLFTVGGCPLLTSETDLSGSNGSLTADSDGDTIRDADDRCPGFDDGSDIDGDGIPDGCDADSARERDDLAGLAAFSHSEDSVDLRDLIVGDRVLFSVPAIDGSEMAKRRLAQTETSDCSCLWSITPSEMGSFDPAIACTTEFTPTASGAAVIMVVQTCGTLQRGFAQGIEVASGIAGSACQSDADCTDPLLTRCDTLRSECVECLSNGDCSSLLPRCLAGECTECLDDAECEDGDPCTEDVCSGGFCESASAPDCSSCSDDEECVGTGTPRCGPAGICVECLIEMESSDCVEPTPRCRVSGICVQCLSNMDCDITVPLCDTVSGTCVSCSDDIHCQDPTPRCDLDTGACVQCVRFDDCDPSELCDIASHECTISAPPPPPAAPPPPAGVCGNGIVEAGEACDTSGESATCDDDCTLVVCGDGNTNQFARETCDTGGESATCDDDCSSVVCGDQNTNQSAQETCDTGGESATCDDDCSAVVCGDGNVNQLAGEACDTRGESATCDDDCTLVVCGDGNVNQTSGETCDTGGESAACDSDCTAVECGDNHVNPSAGEHCDGSDASTCPGECLPNCQCPGIPVIGAIYRGDSAGSPPGSRAVGRSFIVRLLDETGTIELDRDVSTSDGSYSVLIQDGDFVEGTFTGSVEISAGGEEGVRFLEGGTELPLNVDDTTLLVSGQDFTAFFDNSVDGAAPVSGNGTSTSPYHTIQAALDDVFPGDRVIIRPGVYTEHNLTPIRSGTPDRPIVIEGTNQVILPRTGACPSCQDDILSRDDLVVIQGPGTTNTRGFTFNFIANEDVHSTVDPETNEGFGYYVFRNLNLTNFIAPFDFDFGTSENGYSEAAHHVIIEDVNMCFNRRGIRGRRGFHDLIARRVHCFENDLALIGLGPGGVGANGHDFDNGGGLPTREGGPFNLTFLDCDSCDHDDGGGSGGDADSWIFQAEIDNVTLIRCRAFGNAEDGFDFKCNNVFMNQCRAWDNGASACKLGGAEAVDDQARFDRTHTFTVRNSFFVANRDGSSAALLLKRHSMGIVSNCTMISSGLPGNNIPAPVRTLGDSVEARTFTFQNCVFHQSRDQEVALLIFDDNLEIQGSHNLYYREPGETSSRVIGLGLDSGPIFFSIGQVNEGEWTAFLAGGGFGAVPPADLQGIESIAADPLFTQFADPAGPFTLDGQSPAVDSGIDLSEEGADTLGCGTNEVFDINCAAQPSGCRAQFEYDPTYMQRAADGTAVDVDCASRPLGAGFDRGAYEQ